MVCFSGNWLSSQAEMCCFDITRRFSALMLEAGQQRRGSQGSPRVLHGFHAVPDAVGAGLGGGAFLGTLSRPVPALGDVGLADVRGCA